MCIFCTCPVLTQGIAIEQAKKNSSPFNHFKSVVTTWVLRHYMYTRLGEFGAWSYSWFCHISFPSSSSYLSSFCIPCPVKGWHLCKLSCIQKFALICVFCSIGILVIAFHTKVGIFLWIINMDCFCVKDERKCVWGGWHRSSSIRKPLVCVCSCILMSKCCSDSVWTNGTI